MTGWEVKPSKARSSRLVLPFQDIAAFVGISGPFDLVDLSDHFHSRGLDRRLLSSIFEARMKKVAQSRTVSALEVHGSE